MKTWICVEIHSQESVVYTILCWVNSVRIFMSSLIIITWPSNVVVSFEDFWLKYYEIHTCCMLSQSYKPWFHHSKIFVREYEFSEGRLCVILHFHSPCSQLVPLLVLAALLWDTLNIFSSEESEISFTARLVKVWIYIHSSVYFNSYGFRQERSVEFSAGKNLLL